MCKTSHMQEGPLYTTASTADIYGCCYEINKQINANHKVSGAPAISWVRWSKYTSAGVSPAAVAPDSWILTWWKHDWESQFKNFLIYPRMRDVHSMKPPAGLKGSPSICHVYTFPRSELLFLLLCVPVPFINISLSFPFMVLHINSSLLLCMSSVSMHVGSLDALSSSHSSASFTYQDVLVAVSAALCSHTVMLLLHSFL